MTATVSIFGTSQARRGERVYDAAHTLGRMLAEQGFVIANGGYGGTMEAAAFGARQAGGEVIGVTCTMFGRGRANDGITREIVTRTLPERLQTLVDLGDGYIVLPGGTGTLLELAMVWELKHKALIKPPKPIILLGLDWQAVLDTVGRQDTRARQGVLTAASVAEACEYMVAALGKYRKE